MKKKYISPNTLVVELRCKNHLLEGSYHIEDTTVSDTEGGWVKEQNTFSDKNIWDDEW